jgi:hypothetical protein
MLRSRGVLVQGKVRSFDLAYQQFGTSSASKPQNHERSQSH